MFKRIVLGTLLIGLIGVLVAGGIIRTMDKTENVAEARGLGHGQSVGEAGEAVTEGQGQGRGGSAQGGGNWQSAATADRWYPNHDESAKEIDLYEGTVLLTPQMGGDLVITTDEGQEIQVGTGPGYMEQQGFVLQAGERVQVQGYWEDGELKAAQLTRLRDGETITLRDQLGHPAWAGSGKLATERQAAATWSGGQSQGGYDGEGRSYVPGDGAGTGQAKAGEWLALSGVVASIDAGALVVHVDGGGQVEMTGRPWTFAKEQGFTAQAGDRVTVVGFFEGDEFEVGRIDNVSTGLMAVIREEGGRPLWAGRGQRGG
jgi:hypothetical protein